MMISSDPVVSSPEPADSSSFLSSPGKTPLIIQEEQQHQEDKEVEEMEEKIIRMEAEKSADINFPSDDTEKTAPAHPELTGCTTKEAEETGGEDGTGDRGTGGDQEEPQPQLQLSVPDLINKDPPLLEPRAKPCDIWQKATGPDSRLASTPCPGKTPCRISLGEDVLLGNGAPCSKGNTVSNEDAEPHPDLLSFE